MTQELSQRLALDGATLVILGMPAGTEFGIDLNFWNVGERFRGVKMIPPGLHFVYFSAVSQQGGDTAPRTGFFHVFSTKEVLVRHYDPATEDLSPPHETSVEELERIRGGLRDMDRFLGPYPLDSWSKWISLTQHVNQTDLQRMVPLSGRVCSAAELTPVAPFISSKTRHATTTPTTTTTTTTTTTEEETVHTTTTTTTTTPVSHSSTLHTPPIATPGTQVVRGLPEMVPRAGTEFRFSKVPARGYRDGATPSEVTKYSLDSSYSVREMMAQGDRPECLLAELQLSFVSFLVGQVWGCWEHWRGLVGLLCRAEEVLVERPGLYTTLLSVLHYQVTEIPEDLFVDIVERSNFLASALTTLFANVSDNAPSLPPSLVLKAKRFKEHLTKKFEWDLTLEDEGEDAPVVVVL